MFHGLEVYWHRLAPAHQPEAAGRPQGAARFAGRDAERPAQFQRETEVLATPNHPHIAAIYGLERSGALTALVMELVDGEDGPGRTRPVLISLPSAAADPVG